MPDPLLLPIAIPLVAGLVCLLVPNRWAPTRAWFAVAVSAMTLVATWPLFTGDTVISDSGLLRVDKLSGFILLASAVFALLVAVYSLDYMKGIVETRLYFSCMLWSLASASGALLANDFVLLLICWGLLAVTLYLMIGLAGPDASEAARKTFMVVGGSDTLLLLGTALLWMQHSSTRMDAGPTSLVGVADYLAFLCFAAAAFAKLGAVPLHVWLPDCGQRAHAPVTALLPASLDKLLGGYLLARLVMNLFSIGPAINTLLMFLGAITIVGAAFMALVQTDLKRLLAYCAVGQAGYILLGIGTASALGSTAALFHMLNHAIYKTCLFLGAGVVEKRAGSVDLDQLGGLATRLPVTFVTFLTASLAVSGIPPLNGFASKWMVYQAVIESGRDSENFLWMVWLAAAMMGSALTLALFVKVLHGVFLCKPSPHVRDRTIEQPGWSATTPIIVLSGLCVLFGIFADAIPLRYLILPAIGQPLTYPGTWWAGQASGLLMIAFVAGWIVYAITMRNGKLRKLPTYIGGERMAETRIPGVPVGPERHVEVTGVDFYLTIEQLPVISDFYRTARTKIFDIYETSGRASGWLVNLLRIAHGGVLSDYLTWFVMGLLGILYVIMQRTP